jgi:TetR/AcrR family transcriptional regulator
VNGRESILRAAESVFVERGFSGASISEIAHQAGVAKSLIYHHFDSKQQLWYEVVREHNRRSGLLERFYDTLASRDMESLEELTRGESGFFYFLRDHPELVRMMAWLNLEGGLDMDFPDPEARGRIIDRIRELQERGSIRSDLDPVVLPILYMLVCFGWFGSRWKYRKWFPEGLSDAQLDSRFIGAAMDIIWNGMTTDDD